MTADPRATATKVVEMARDERFAEVEALFAAPLRAAVSADMLRAAWATEASQTGPVTAIGEPVTEPGEAGLVRVSVPVTCERGGLTVIMSVDDSGMLNGLRLAPPATSWAPPSYAKPRRFTEQEVMVGTAAGTLTLPKKTGPGVVLLSGGGPFDRDGTSGPNKPLKDLAWGLASRGIAVVRFDKTAAATMAEEYVPPAIAAVQLLRKHTDQVFMLGHSMGGKVAPRIVAAEPSIAGMVLMAADASPMHHAAVRVARYLASVDPGLEAMIAEFTKQAALVDSPDLAPTDMPFGMPGTYWLDMRDYDPVATAAALDTPMLILQGARDYQVTVEDDLALWRAGLGHRPDVTIHVHDADDHMFFPGKGPSTPADYQAPQHIDPAVIKDIAAWLNR